MITALLSQELDSSQLKELQAALKGFVQKNETLKIETKVSRVVFHTTFLVRTCCNLSI